MTSGDGLFCKRDRVFDMAGHKHKARTISRAKGRAQEGDDLLGLLIGVHAVWSSGSLGFDGHGQRVSLS